MINNILVENFQWKDDKDRTKIINGDHLAKSIDNCTDEIITYFAKKDNGQFLAQAKTKYFNLTGNVDHDTQDFEHKMKSFTEWFVLHYSPFRFGEKIYQVYD
jgi:hypothetical protein